MTMPSVRLPGAGPTTFHTTQSQPPRKPQKGCARPRAEGLAADRHGRLPKEDARGPAAAPQAAVHGTSLTGNLRGRGRHPEGQAADRQGCLLTEVTRGPAAAPQGRTGHGRGTAEAGKGEDNSELKHGE